MLKQQKLSGVKCVTLFVAAITGAVFLTQCDFPGVTPDTESLKAQSNSALVAPNCNSCHALVENDANHKLHLTSLNQDRLLRIRSRPNGFITCMDCHDQSVAHFSSTHSETLWVDTNGLRSGQRNSPSDQVDKVTNTQRFRPLPYGLIDTTRGEGLGVEVDSLIASYSRINQSPPWRTAWHHNNGKVNIDFPSNVLNPDFPGVAYYRPETFTCSAIACHSNPIEDYEWVENADDP